MKIELIESTAAKCRGFCKGKAYWRVRVDNNPMNEFWLSTSAPQTEGEAGIINLVMHQIAERVEAAGLMSRFITSPITGKQRLVFDDN